MKALPIVGAVVLVGAGVAAALALRKASAWVPARHGLHVPCGDGTYKRITDGMGGVYEVNLQTGQVRNAADRQIRPETNLRVKFDGCRTMAERDYKAQAKAAQEATKRSPLEMVTGAVAGAGGLFGGIGSLIGGITGGEKKA